MTYTPYEKNPVKTWQELMVAEAAFAGTDEWAFRGQDVLDFPATSLERHCKNLGVTGSAIQDLEIKLIRDFARSYHLYSGSAPPEKGYTLEWLSLLRHYGTPTRLLDFSYSFFIATFFALESADSSAVIWAVNATRLAREAEAHIAASVSGGETLIEDYRNARDGEPFRALFMRLSALRFAHLANPLRFSERLTIQQGMFLAPGDVTATFEENLAAVPNHASCVTKIVIDSTARKPVLRKLHRMGINSASLYPGLEGFARSLRTKSLVLLDLPQQDVDMLSQI